MVEALNKWFCKLSNWLKSCFPNEMKFKRLKNNDCRKKESRKKKRTKLRKFILVQGKLSRWQRLLYFTICGVCFFCFLFSLIFIKYSFLCWALVHKKNIMTLNYLKTSIHKKTLIVCFKMELVKRFKIKAVKVNEWI